jgi:transposase-like protein
MTSEKRAARRQFSAALKAQVVAECDAPGASVAKVAMSLGVVNIPHTLDCLSPSQSSPFEGADGARLLLVFE